MKPNLHPFRLLACFLFGFTACASSEGASCLPAEPPAWEPALPEKFPNGVRVPTLHETYPNFVVCDGDAARLERVFEKGLRGEPLVIAVIGGSITQGAHAGSRERQWGRVLADWFCHVFPKSKVEYVNAGIGATGSAYAAFRVEKDVCVRKPDVVGVEFAVNDPDDEATTEYNEGLIRHLLKTPTRPFVFQLSMVSRTRVSRQNRHIPVSRHYGIPHFSFRDAFLPLFESGKLTHKDLARDELHPDEVGHPYMAALVCRYLNGKLADYLKAGRKPKSVPRLPDVPLVGTLFDTGSVVLADEIKILENHGFSLEKNSANKAWKGKGLCGKAVGDSVTFEVEAASCSLLYFCINGPMGRAHVTVDGGAPICLDGWFAATWGGYTPIVQLWKNRSGRHVVKVEIDGKTSDRKTNGHFFEIDAILTASPE